MVDTTGYVERAILATLSHPSGLYPIKTDEDVEVTPVVESFKTREASVAEVQDHLLGMTDATVESRGVSIRRAFGRLEEGGLIERVGTEGGRNYYSLTDRGLDECNRLYHEYMEEYAALRKRYGGDWSLFDSG